MGTNGNEQIVSFVREEDENEACRRRKGEENFTGVDCWVVLVCVSVPMRLGEGGVGGREDVG